MDMILETSLDYLTITCKEEGVPIRHPLLGLVHKELPRGMFGYTVATKYTDGRIEASNPKRPEMGRMMSYTGSAVDAAREHVSDFDLLSWHVAQGHRVTRVDFAIDAYDSELDIDVLKNMVVSGEVTTNSKSFYMGDSVTNEGKTLYIGWRKEKTVRIYNKAAERGVPLNWKRVEFQLRSDYAAQAALAVSQGRGDEYNVVCGLIKQFVDFKGNSAWCDVLSGCADVRIKEKKKGESARELWILGDVSKAIAKEMQDGNVDIMDKLLARVMLELQISAESMNIHKTLV